MGFQAAGGAADLGGQLRRLQQRHDHQIAACRKRLDAVLGQCGRVSQQTEGALRVGLSQQHDLRGVGVRRIQQPDKAAVPGGLGHQLAQALVAAAGRRDPGNGLTFEVSLLFQLTGTVNQPAKAHIDADGADAILIHGIQQTVDKAVVAAVRALQSLLRVGKKILLLLLFSQCGTHIHIVAQLAEAAAADVPHCAVCQRHGKAACAVVIHSQSVHSLSC